MRRGVRLGVDVGSVRVGLATSDPDGLLATPLRTLDRRPSRAAAHASSVDAVSSVNAVAAVVADHDVAEVVVGLPRSLSGGEGAAAEAARAYAVEIARAVSPVPVRLVDERLSTVSAHQRLREAGMQGRRQRAVVDQVAAVVILQAALDEERATGRPPGTLVVVDGAAEGAAPGAGEARR